MEELSIETNAPTKYGKYVDECLNEAAKHFFSEEQDKYSVADLFYAGIKCKEDWLEKQKEQKSNLYSRVSFEYNGHTWGMCARDGGVEILIDGQLKSKVFVEDTNVKEMFIKALERVEEQNNKGYKLTDCDKNSWWEDFKTYISHSIREKNEFDNFSKVDDNKPIGCNTVDYIMCPSPNHGI